MPKMYFFLCCIIIDANVAEDVMSRNDQLKQACEAWLRAALLFLQRVPSQPYYEDIDVTFDSEGRYATHPAGQKTDAMRLVINNSKELFSLPEFETVLDIVIHTPALFSVLCPDREGQPPNDHDYQRTVVVSYFTTFLVEYISAKQDFAFTLPIFEHIYQKLEEYIYDSEPITTKTIIHIRNLRSEVENVSIGNHVFLRRATYEEKKAAFTMSMPGIALPVVPETMLEIHHRLAPTVPLQATEQQEVYEIAQAVVFALRLIKSNPVELRTYYWDVSDQPFRRRGGMGGSIFQMPFSYLDNPYILTSEDVDALAKLWPKAKKAYNKPELAMARTRLEGSYLRTTLDDMLIDYWIGLEALFLPPDHTREMAEAAALAVSNYLGRTAQSRSTIYHEVIESHKLRGKVVHGKQVDGKKLREMYTKTGNLLRRSLRERIEEE